MARAVDGVDFNGQKGTNAATPTVGTDVVNKNYSDAQDTAVQTAATGVAAAMALVFGS